ncbi:helix-turn-helix transcriptional regulator [Moritella sp. F3]|uniref:helix-turn-helix transcriptional regulator n=1 Tax=Moritella sp. F3 TaxID=2718882 RepID=UPI001A2F7032|nr:AraC family transcriptional regulator [Moritella sp. F3]GIC76953.1 AraC family transcriptional regulator [Moritella sp. F1]GIC80136.1 AraC family transcriptional regulator [Moritella sp. F3]
MNLFSAIQKEINEKHDLPFAIYSSIKEQHLLNVPIMKPLLMVVLSGNKTLGKDNELVCHTGDFIFLSNRPAINMRNIPKDKAYCALLIEFDYQDFNGLQTNTLNKQDYCIGKTTLALEKCLQQFVESTQWAPKQLWSLRKREIIELLCHMGHSEILSMVGNPEIGHRLHDMFSEQNCYQLSIKDICEQLAMSESTLRRKLKVEGTSVQEIKDQARLGLGLHLLQTTRQSIVLIAEKCGYHSQSRFTDRFKGRFGLTPSELRKTKMAD